MTDTNFPLTADSDFDDLPRTLRREKEARAREARERRDRERGTMDASRGDPPAYVSRAMPVVYGDEPVAASVRRFDVPFFHMMMFFMKAVVAAVPALMLLGAMLYFAGQALETHFPELLRMKILITFPS